MTKTSRNQNRTSRAPSVHFMAKPTFNLICIGIDKTKTMQSGACIANTHVFTKCFRIVNYQFNEPYNKFIIILHHLIHKRYFTKVLHHLLENFPKNISQMCKNIHNCITWCISIILLSASKSAYLVLERGRQFSREKLQSTINIP